MMRMGHGREAYTLIEVLAGVLVLSLGLFSACAMTLYGLSLSRSAHARTMGMATALTVLADPTPLATDVALSASGAATVGFLNGLWVERTETDPTALDNSGKLVAVTVVVNVYDLSGGTNVASANRRMIKVLP